MDVRSADLPMEAERSQAVTAGKAQVQSEAEREKEWRKDYALTDEDFGSRESNHCVCYMHLTASLQGLINQ